MGLRIFGWSFAVTAAILGASLALGGPAVLATVAILAILEVSVSFDNAVVNAGVLNRLSEAWQKLFLTVGLVLAVFGMRLLFPVVVVAASARISPLEAVRLALSPGDGYQVKLETAHPVIASFGGMFLLLLFLDFFLTDRKDKWLGWLERPLAGLGRRWKHMALPLGLGILLVIGFFSSDPPGPAHHASRSVVYAGLLGMAVYTVLKRLSDRFGARASGADTGQQVGRAALLLFLYLEVLDASFSFDGVIGAFAITDNLFVIAAGLGVGAMYIRSMTVFLVRKGALTEYVYLEHGAHWAIGGLAVAMLVGIPKQVPDAVSGGLGAAFIGAALVTSLVANRRRREGVLHHLDQAVPAPRQAAEHVH